MSRHTQILAKWLPNLVEYEKLFRECRELQINIEGLINRCNMLLHKFNMRQTTRMNHLVDENEFQASDIEDLSVTIETITENFEKVFNQLDMKDLHPLTAAKFENNRKALWIGKLKLQYLIQDIIQEICSLYLMFGDSLFILAIRISLAFNKLYSMDKKYALKSDLSICNNGCPYIMFPMRKFSVTRLLQMVALNRAELCCHKLIDCLLETYKSYQHDEDDGSDSSSLEIYMTLTKHMTPHQSYERLDEPGTVTPEKNKNGFANLEELIFHEERRVIAILRIILKSAPEMLGIDGLKKCRNTGVVKLNTKAQNKALEYYEQILWGEVSNYLEHVILWWASSPLAARPPHSSQHLREWIMQFIPTADIPSVILSALASLADALGVHVTSTSWDQNFRKALVASKVASHPDTGRLFSDVLQELVTLCNQCETTPDWIMGAALHELPLVEQIPVLHRLDHSIHTTRLWSINESKKMANVWNVKGFFKVTQGDIADCLKQLNDMKLTDHTLEIEKGGLDVHVQVCALMRAKLVSEVKDNMQKLKETPQQCVEGLASVCRTICLANLKMIFPKPSYWKQTVIEGVSEKPSEFVEKYLNQILVPVLEATEDYDIANMILTLVCESWLDHIYTNKIKFSEHGACQLLCDFAYVTAWLTNCLIVSETMRKKLLKNEILRRCEGVGRLLLRCPGEKIKMTDKNKRKVSVAAVANDTEKSELMPAEMYVPNQEQWLALRAARKTLFPAPTCCGKYQHPKCEN